MSVLSSGDVVYNTCPFLDTMELSTLASCCKELKRHVLNSVLTGLAQSFKVSVVDLRFVVPQSTHDIFRLATRIRNQADLVRFADVFLYACASGFTFFVELLMDESAKIYKHALTSRLSSDGDSCLILASRNGHGRIVEVLLENGVSSLSCDSRGRSALWHACRNGHYAIAEFLLRFGASVHSNPCLILTLLSQPRWTSAGLQIFELVVSEHLLILENEMATIESWNESSHNRPLQTLSRLISSIKYCILSPTLPNVAVGMLALIHKRGTALTSFIRLLMQSQEPLLVCAVVAENPTLLGPLVSSGLASVRDCAHAGEKTPLYVASEHGNLECVKVLLELGASVGDQTSTGRNCLHAAVERGHASVVELLCTHASAKDILHLNSSQISPFTLAENRGRTRMVVAMLECYKCTASGETLNATLNSKVDKYLNKSLKKTTVAKKKFRPPIARISLCS